MRQLKIKVLLTIAALSALINVTFAQTGEGRTIEGEVSVISLTAVHKMNDSYVMIQGTDNKATIDSSGHFRLINVKEGENKLRIQLWNGILIQDTVLNVQRDIVDFSYITIFDCEVNKYEAAYDIRYDKPKLLLSGGIAPVVYDGQENFEHKYGISYGDFGCVSPSYDCVIEYNQVIFDYLDQTYGKKWRKEVRKDVIGLKRKQKRKVK